VILSFSIPGAPVTWKRTNTFNGRRITDVGDRIYRKHVQMCAWSALLKSPLPRNKRYALTLAVCPATRADSDLSNYLKQIEDALNGVVWDDDSQIDRVVVDRLWHGEAGVLVTVEVIGDAKPERVASEKAMKRAKKARRRAA
jgi:Holliday junction resolvase RusA-like endonuclease